MSFEVERDRRHLRALSHPVRLQVLSLLTGTTMSSTELAKDMGMSQAAVSFHVRQLADAGLIELAETRSVRGGQEKRYRLAAQQGTDGRADMLSSAAAASSEVRRRLLEGNPPGWDLFSDVDIWVDEQTWIRCARAVADAMEALHEAATDKASEGAIKVSATALLFRYSTTRARRGTRGTSASATARQGTVKKPKQVRVAPSSSSRGRGADT
jgi:DNA-binding transcriptional ArsR family regulator